MTRITSDDVRKVAKLSRLDIPDDEVEKYSNQLEDILEYIAQLERIDTKDVPPTTRAVEVVNVFREGVKYWCGYIEVEVEEYIDGLRRFDVLGPDIWQVCERRV